jgi:hypothetical protein
MNDSALTRDADTILRPAILEIREQIEVRETIIMRNVMHGPIHTFFTEDHRRLDGLFRRATMKPGTYDMAAYNQFRVGLLKHIKMEENILFPAIHMARSGVPLPIMPKLRLDHGALSALLVPPPSPTIITALRSILAGHNILEEQLEGMYDICDELVHNDIDELLRRIEHTSDVPVVAHKTDPVILEATRRALARAGYNYDDYETLNE